MSNTSTSSVRATKKLIPDLRFPEFVNEGEWEEITIKSIGDVVTGGTPSKEENEYWSGDFVWVTAQDFKEKYIYDSVLKLTKKGKGKSRVIPKNSVLVTCIASIGLNGINKVECATNQQINSIVCNLLNHYEFVYYAISKNITRLKNMAGQTAVPIISKSVFEKFTIQKPQKPEEQHKIASCLSSLDEVITAHSQKLGLLKEHKKGLMQNLFSQEGETVPKFRFKEFDNDGEWVEKTLGSVAEIVTGSTPSTIETINYNGTRLFVSPADINDNRYITQTKTTLSEIGFSKTRKIKSNSVLFVCIGSTIGKVAQNKFECATNQQLNSLIPYEGNSSDFLYSILDKNSTKIASIAGNHAVPIINKTSFSAIKLCFPPKPNEQQKIASCLSSLDDLITAQTEKIEQLKLHKKGLTQGLFPRMSEL